MLEIKYRCMFSIVKTLNSQGSAKLTRYIQMRLKTILVSILYTEARETKINVKCIFDNTTEEDSFAYYLLGCKKLFVLCKCFLCHIDAL